MKVLAIVLGMTCLLNSCNIFDCIEGQGKIITRSFPQSSITKFSLDLSADVELIPSSTNRLEITTYENIFEKLEIENRNEDLELDARGCVELGESTKIRLYFTNLSEVEIQGSGNLVAVAPIKTDEFTIDIQGSGDADLTLETGSLNADIMGSGDILLKGTTGSLSITINGSGDIKAKGLKAQKTEVKINGSGNAMLGNCQNLSSHINGSGTVDCK